MMMLYTTGVSQTQNEHGDEFSEAYITIQLNEILKQEYQVDKILQDMNAALAEFKNNSQDSSGGVMLLFRFFG